MLVVAMYVRTCMQCNHGVSDGPVTMIQEASTSNIIHTHVNEQQTIGCSHDNKVGAGPGQVQTDSCILYQKYINDKSAQPPIPSVVHPFSKMTQ